MRRFFGFAFGLSAQLAFLLTLLPLYQFLHNDFASAEPGSLWIDALLAIQFVIPHSVLLHPQVKTRIVRWVPG